MAINIPQYNTILDANVRFARAFAFYEDDALTPIPVSAWVFSAQLRDASDVVVWSFVNNDFARTANSITLIKTIEQVAALASGLYTFSLQATNGVEFSDDEILNGYWRK
jgi:hypothetical protein